MVWKIRRRNNEKIPPINHRQHADNPHRRGCLKPQSLENLFGHEYTSGSKGSSSAFHQAKSSDTRSTSTGSKRSNESSRGSRSKADSESERKSRSSRNSDLYTKSVGSDSQQRSIKKSVRFTDIQIREYERTLGDNPSCSSGAPVSIGWGHATSEIVDIDIYEDARPRRRPQQELVLSREYREAILREWNIPHEDIIQATRNNLKAKFNRRRTVRNIRRVEKLEIVFEGAAKGLKRALHLRRRTEDELQELQEQADIAAAALKAARISDEADMDVVPSTFDDGNVSICEPEGDADLDHMKVEVSDFCQSYPIESMVYANGAAEPSSLDDSASSMSGITLGNSTSTSMIEMERFYRELEVEMFGEGDSRSPIGQTLELPEMSKDELGSDTASATEDISVSSSPPSDFAGERTKTLEKRREHVFQEPHNSAPQEELRAMNFYEENNPQMYSSPYMQYNHQQEYNHLPQTSSFRGYSVWNAYRSQAPPSNYNMQNLMAPTSTQHNMHSTLGYSHLPAQNPISQHENPFWRQNSSTLPREILKYESNDNMPPIRHQPLPAANYTSESPREIPKYKSNDNMPPIRHQPFPTADYASKWMEENAHNTVTISEERLH